jgi:hypothetical protein
MVVIRQTIPPQRSDLSIVQLTKLCFCIVDHEDLPWLCHYDWRLVKSKACYYAARRVLCNGHYHYIRMHRQLMNAPPEMQVHHINGNSLDNRKCNLSVIEPRLHASLRFGR